MKRFCKDQDGAAIAVFFVILVPLMFVVLVGIITFTSAITNSDVTVQESVALSSKAAAMAFDPTAQANGIIRINAEQAHENFKKSLCETLGLNDDLTPSTKAFADQPKYWLLVYNSHDDYEDCPPVILYSHDNPGGVSLDTPSKTFSVSETGIAVSETGIVTGEGGEYEVTLETPGVISIVKIDASNIVNKSPTTIVRWAAARIVGQDGSLKVI